MIWGAFLKKYWNYRHNGNPFTAFHLIGTQLHPKKFVAVCSYLLILSVIDIEGFC